MSDAEWAIATWPDTYGPLWGWTVKRHGEELTCMDEAAHPSREAAREAAEGWIENRIDAERGKEEEGYKTSKERHEEFMRTFKESLSEPMHPRITVDIDASQPWQSIVIAVVAVGVIALSLWVAFS